MLIDASKLYGHASPLTLVDLASSDAMASVLLKATYAAILWSRRKHFLLFLYGCGFRHLVASTETASPADYSVGVAEVNCTGVHTLGGDEKSVNMTDSHRADNCTYGHCETFARIGKDNCGPAVKRVFDISDLTRYMCMFL